MRIINGPDRSVLVGALFDPDNFNPVTFICCHDPASREFELKLNIESVAIVPGRHDRLHFTAYGGSSGSFKGVIDVVTRKGELQAIGPAPKQVACPKCGTQATLDEGTYLGEPIYKCGSCRVTCDWDEECHGPFLFVSGDPSGDGQPYVLISFCSSHNHD